MDSANCYAAVGGTFPLVDGNGHHVSFQVCHDEIGKSLTGSTAKRSNSHGDRKTSKNRTATRTLSPQPIKRSRVVEQSVKGNNYINPSDTEVHRCGSSFSDWANPGRTGLCLRVEKSYKWVLAYILIFSQKCFFADGNGIDGDINIGWTLPATPV
jgi:hypothetical protein